MNTRLKFLLSLYLIFLLASCSSYPDLKTGLPVPLASFSENGVTVALALKVTPSGQAWLTATFTPPDGFHLYSKDLPRNGSNGEGRPTLLELPSSSTLRAAGDLVDSANAEVSSMGTDALLVYPAGPVTLGLPVTLPEGKDWGQQQVSITYEACSDMSCLTPVVGKLVPIRVPDAGLVGG